MIKPAKIEVLQQVVREVIEESRKGPAAAPAEPKAAEEETLREYSEVTFRKLQSKVKQLENEATARAQAEAALRESEWRYRALVDHAPIGIVVHENGTVRFMNNFAAACLGFKDPREYLGRNILEYIPPDCREAVKERYRFYSYGDAMAVI